MATLRLALKCPFLATNNAKQCQKAQTNSMKEAVLTDIGSLFEQIAGGRRSGASGQAQPSLIFSIDESCTAATATITLAAVSAADTVTIGNIVFTAVNGGPVGNQFDMSGTDTADAASLVTAVNANATLSKYLTASSALGVVTLTAKLAALGTIANLFALTSSNGTRIAVVGFASGVDDSSARTYSF